MKLHHSKEIQCSTEGKIIVQLLESNWNPTCFVQIQKNGDDLYMETAKGPYLLMKLLYDSFDQKDADLYRKRWDMRKKNNGYLYP
jgi:hypothetical protein